MTKRIFRSILLVSTSVFLIGLAFILAVLYQSFDDQLIKELQNEVAYLSISVEQGGTGALDELSNQAERITLISSDGTVLYDNQFDEESMENHLDREEIQEALQNGSGQAVRQSDTMSERTIYYAVRLDDGSVLRVSSTQYTVASILIDLLIPFLWILLLLLIVSGLCAFRLSKKIVEPLNQLDLEHPDANESYDEIAPLLTKINQQQRTIKEQIREFKRHQQEFSMITDCMEEGLVIIDKRGEILSYNESALTLLGAKSYPQPLKNIIEFNRTEVFRNAVDKVLRGEHTEAILDCNGISCQLTANPVQRHGTVEGAVLLFVDVTEKFQREKLRREFTANVSHELKTPLTSISGFAEIIQNGFVKQEDITQFAGRIFSEAQRLIVLVNDIVKISQLDEEALPYQKESVDLYQMAGEILDRLRPVAEKQNITLDLKGESVVLSTVRPIVEEIIYNLCDNAIKYNRPNGSVVVTVKQTEEEIQLEVKDTGIGISQAHQQRIFERFYRVDKSHSNEIGGTGLGLSIVKHGVSYLGAKIAVNSELGVGTTFLLTWDKNH